MKAVLDRSIEDYEKAQTLTAPVFFDRGIPEWLRFLGSDEEPCRTQIAQYRYASTVFVAEPWPEIYVRDDERTHSYESAVRSYMPTVSSYLQAGYGTCVIPKVSVQERAAFVLAQVGGRSRRSLSARAHGPEAGGGDNRLPTEDS